MLYHTIREKERQREREWETERQTEEEKLTHNWIYHNISHKLYTTKNSSTFRFFYFENHFQLHLLIDLSISLQFVFISFSVVIEMRADIVVVVICCYRCYRCWSCDVHIFTFLEFFFLAPDFDYFFYFLH